MSNIFFKLFTANTILNPLNSINCKSNVSVRPHRINFMDDGFLAEENGASEEGVFFQRKKRKNDVIFRREKEILSPNKNKATKKKKIQSR